MINYNEYVDKIENIKRLFYKYKDQYTLFQNQVKNCKKIDYFRSRKTIHNIEYSLRPDMTKIIREFPFFDFSSFWRCKKTYCYSIFVDTNERVHLISVDREKFKEFWVYIEGGIILIDYLKCGDSYTILSLGEVKIINNKIVDFTLLEVEKEYALDIDFILRTEQYEFNESGDITEVTTYIYDSRKKITASDTSLVGTELGCIVNKTLYANPEIFKHTLIYNEYGELIEAFCANYFDAEKKAKLSIIKNNN